MSHLNVTINGRQYRMACEDGQEDRLLKLAGELESRIGELRGKFGEIGDQRLEVMAALTTSDELRSRVPPSPQGGGIRKIGALVAAGICARSRLH